MRERGKYRILWEKGESKRYEYKKGESIGYYERNCSWFNLTRDKIFTPNYMLRYVNITVCGLYIDSKFRDM